MFGLDFYPTPHEIIETMIGGIDLTGKRVLDPSAGKGDIVDHLKNGGAEVYACEIDKYLYKLLSLSESCTLIAEDFLTVTSEQISHIDYIVMNPPFSRGAEHILHAYDIAPPGCQLIALCNSETLKNTYSKSRERLKDVVETFGQSQELGDCFTLAERKTGVNVTLIRIYKPGENNREFDGFFMEEEEEEQTGPGLIPYNVIRDLVNRYVRAVQIFDQQLETAVQLKELTSGFYGGDLGLQVTRNGLPLARNQFKKGMQRSGWEWIFSKLNMQKYATKGLKEDINKFIETQSEVPFTMRNIYRMLEIVIATQGSQIDKAILQIFDKVTGYHDDNKQGIPGWKTNSHFLLTKRFIMPSLVKVGWDGVMDSDYSSNNFQMVEDLVKCICYITGDNYDDQITLYTLLQHRFFLADKDGKYYRNGYGSDALASDKLDQMEYHQANKPGSKIVESVREWGKWFEWGYFRIRAYKKGTIHFEFKDESIWARFNQRVAKLKGYPLPEKKERTAYQKRQTYTKETEPMFRKAKEKAKIFETFKF